MSATSDDGTSPEPLSRTEEEMVAYALEVDPELLPLLPELLVDFEELGSDAEAIVELLEGLDLPSSAKVLDLGCGKGAVSFEVADELGLAVLGIDLFEPFIDGCQREVKTLGLEDLCEFRVGNVAELAGKLEPVDVAIYVALGDVLGPLDVTLGILRLFVKPGGHLVVGDNYLKDGGHNNFPGFESCESRELTLKRLQSHGDVVVKEVVDPSDTSGGFDEDSESLFKRAEELSIKNPEMASALQKFAQSQRAEWDYLADNLVGVTWLIRRQD